MKKLFSVVIVVVMLANSLILSSAEGKFTSVVWSNCINSCDDVVYVNKKEISMNLVDLQTKKTRYKYSPVNPYIFLDLTNTQNAPPIWTIDKNGKLYFKDLKNNKSRNINPSTDYIEILIGKTCVYAFASDNQEITITVLDLEGNVKRNISCYGNIKYVLFDDSVYFTKGYDKNDGLYRISQDDDKPTLLTKEKVETFQICSNRLFVTTSESLLEIKKDTIILYEKAKQFTATESGVYGSYSANVYEMISYNSEYSGLKRVYQHEKNIVQFICEQNTLYFLDNSCKLFSLDSESGDVIQVFDEDVTALEQVDGHWFACIEDNNGTIQSIDNKGSRKNIHQGNVDVFTVKNNVMAFIDDKGVLNYKNISKNKILWAIDLKQYGIDSFVGSSFKNGSCNLALSDKCLYYFDAQKGAFVFSLKGDLIETYGYNYDISLYKDKALIFKGNKCIIKNLKNNFQVEVAKNDKQIKKLMSDEAQSIQKLPIDLDNRKGFLLDWIEMNHLKASSKDLECIENQEYNGPFCNSEVIGNKTYIYYDNLLIAVADMKKKTFKMLL